MEANAARLAIVGPFPDLPSPRHARIRGQHPAPGTHVPPGSPISVWIDHSVPEDDDAHADEHSRGPCDRG